MKKHIISAVFIGLIICGCSNEDGGDLTQLSLLPYPQELTMQEGHLFPSGEVRLRSSGVSENSDPIIYKQLSLAFDEAFSVSIKVEEESPPHIWIGLPESDESFKSRCEREIPWPDQRIGEEGYMLKISMEGILLAANTNQGLFYGVQTLRQLFREFDNEPGIPALLIIDWPAIPVRAIMDDISRGQIPSNAYIKEQIRRYSEMKINQMSFYIEHVVKTEKHPGFSPDDGALSIEEIQELSEYARDYHIKLIGSFQSLGHFEKILSVPEFRYLGATDRMLDPLNPRAMEFLRDVYKEMAPVFSSEWFTPNCDEAWDLSRVELTGDAARLGVAQIYADHIKRIDTTLLELEKRTLIWGDIIMEFPEILDLLPPHILIGAWNYDASESFAEFIDPLKNAGFEFTVSPGVLNSTRLFPDFNQAFVNIRNFINEGHEKGTIGVYCTIWDDGGPHFFNHDWYGVAYAAEHCWRPNREPREAFDLRFSRSFYGDGKNSVPEGINVLNELAELGPSYEMNEWIFSKYMIPEPGKTISYNLQEWEDIRKIAEEALHIFNGGELFRHTDDLASMKFVCQQYLFLAEGRLALFEAAKKYRDALETGNSDKEQTLALLNSSSELIAAQSQSFEKLFKSFEYLWSLESRPHWWNESIVVYERRMDAFAAQLSLLDEAISTYKSGNTLPPAKDVCLGIDKHSGQAFQFWLTCGPIPISETSGPSEDFLLSMGGEGEARPYPGMEISYHETEKIRWHKYDSPFRHMVDLNDACPSQDISVTYAYCSLDAPAEKLTPASLEFEDGATLYCNGEKIFEEHSHTEILKKEFDLPLIKGRNHIMLKFDRTDPARKFTFKLSDEDVRNHKQRYSIH